MKTTDVVLKTFKLFVFFSLLFTAAMMYYMGSIQWGNDLLLCAGLLVALNKLDAMD